MSGRIRLVFNKKDRTLEIHQDGVDIDGMAIGHIYNVGEVVDERESSPLSKYMQMVHVYDSDGKDIAGFWREDIESVEVIE